MSNPARFIPILYDPTVADACLTFGHIYRRAGHVYYARNEGTDRGSAAQLAAAGYTLHLCFDRRPYPRSRRYRCQRHGNPDWQAATLYRVRGGPASVPAAGAVRYRYDQ